MSLFSVRVFKEVVGRPEVAWANTYEIDVVGGLSYELADTIAATFISAESEMHLEFVRFVRCTVSTWTPDSKPYDPEALYTFSGEGIIGQAAAAGDPENLDTVLWVKRIAENGRNGRLFYRGVLVDSDTQENAQRKVGLTAGGQTRCNLLVVTFKNIIQAQSEFFTNVMAGKSLIDKDYLPSPGGVPQQVVKTYGDAHVRAIRNFVVGGATRSKTDYGYYDRP